MKKNSPIGVVATLLFLAPVLLFGQTAPNMNGLSDFSTFTSSGAVTITASQISGNVGTHSGAINFAGSATGQTYNGNTTTANVANALAAAYLNLTNQQPTTTLNDTLGGGQVLTTGVYSILAASTLDGTLTLDALGDASAVFIIKIDGALTSTAGSSVQLLNGAQACNVFWRINGAATLATNTNFKGNIIGNGALTFETGTVLEGRALTIFDAITITSSNVTTPTCNAIILPVQLLSFNGTINGTKAVLSWATSSESNSDYFNVEESNDLLKWTILTTVKAANVSNTLKNYSATDFNLQNGFNYYRLKQVDREGVSRYYKTLALKTNNSHNQLDVLVYPNPTINQFNITIAVDQPSTAYVQIFDLVGRKISVDNIKTSSGINTFFKSITNLLPGNYLIKVATDNAVKTTYFVKQ